MFRTPQDRDVVTFSATRPCRRPTEGRREVDAFGGARQARTQGDKVYLRAQTRVRRHTKTAKTFATFTLIQGVALK